MAANDIFADKPIVDPKDDLLDRWHLAKGFAEMIIDYRDEECLVTSIEGSWGSGKTSFINFVEKAVLSNAKPLYPIKTIRFEPWLFSNLPAMIKDFFTVFKKALPESVVDLIGADWDAFAKIASAIKIKTPIIDVDLSKFCKADNDLLSTKRELFSTIKNSCKERFVVFIDNLDRLDPDEICMIFKLINQLADFPKTIFVLAFDRKQVVRALTRHKHMNGEEYLQKIIQVHNALPEPNPDTMRSYFESNLKKVVQTYNLQMGSNGTEERNNELLSCFFTLKDIMVGSYDIIHVWTIRELNIVFNNLTSFLFSRKQWLHCMDILDCLAYSYLENLKDDKKTELLKELWSMPEKLFWNDSKGKGTLIEYLQKLTEDKVAKKCIAFLLNRKGTKYQINFERLYCFINTNVIPYYIHGSSSTTEVSADERDSFIKILQNPELTDEQQTAISQDSRFINLQNSLPTSISLKLLDKEQETTLKNLLSIWYKRTCSKDKTLLKQANDMYTLLFANMFMKRNKNEENESLEKLFKRGESPENYLPVIVSILGAQTQDIIGPVVIKTAKAYLRFPVDQLMNLHIGYLLYIAVRIDDDEFKSNLKGKISERMNTIDGLIQVAIGLCENTTENGVVVSTEFYAPFEEKGIARKEDITKNLKDIPENEFEQAIDGLSDLSHKCLNVYLNDINASV